MGGLATFGKQQALIGLMPAATSFYAAFLTALPTDDGGAGLVEATGSGYARQVHSSWLNLNETPEWYRVNSGAIDFGVLSADLVNIVGWAIYTAISGGSLVAWGPLLDVGENEIIKTFTSGNQPRFVSQELKVGID